MESSGSERKLSTPTPLVGHGILHRQASLGVRIEASQSRDVVLDDSWHEAHPPHRLAKLVSDHLRELYEDTKEHSRRLHEHTALILSRLETKIGTLGAQMEQLRKECQSGPGQLQRECNLQSEKATGE